MRLSDRIYNYTLKTLTELKIQKQKIPPKYVLRDTVKTHFKDHIKKYDMPNTSVEYAIFEARLAVKAGNDTTDRSFTTSKKYSIAIDGRCMKNGILYINNTKRFIKQRVPKINKEMLEKHRLHQMKALNKICRLVYSERKFFVIKPVAIDKTDKITEDIIALDPGIRSFLAYYDGNVCGEIGKDFYLKIKRFSKKIDQLQSKITSSSWRRRKNQRIAKNRLEEKIKHLVLDLHKKTVHFLSKYKYVLLPKFKVKQLVEKTKNKSVKRSLLTLSHFAFKLRLTQKASEIGNSIIICNEAWTSKTCTGCGNIDRDLGSSKTYDCKKCKLCIDRDINGARNILLRVLRGGSSE
tara:strand:- start:25892 stop:26941 length:1050 start_codon:yes stop_codon:yes gene_type:complete